MTERITILQGDITKCQTDAIVNATNTSLLGGGGDEHEPALLAACYQNSLALAHERGIKSIAFPSVSTGVYGYPMEQACRVALRETFTHLQAHDLPQRVIFVCFSASDLECYQAAISESA